VKPVLIDFGWLKIYSYGLMLSLGFVAALIISRRIAREKGMDPDLVYDLVIISAIAGIIGARISYVAYNWEIYAPDPLAALNLTQGGLTIYGGVVLALIAVTIWVLLKKLDWFVTADVAAVGMPLAIAIGRIGCYLNGCCYGKPTDSFLGVVFPVLHDGLARHPTQLYEVAYSLVIFAILYVFRAHFTRDGGLFFAFLGLYGIFRFANEFLRVNPPLLLGLSGSQLVSIGTVLASAAFFLWPRSAEKAAPSSAPRQQHGARTKRRR
jgi:phosphatidylglycerol:prolipoprotein diacylglycerol transferase